MTLDVIAVQGRVTWWSWVIRDGGGVVEESRTQFQIRSAAEADGQVRLAELEARSGRARRD
ncbi:MAG: hypothetical protein HY217_13175 [Candidatus Rokubacteria bacterium]|nr:hypothetical protein [Candidatus Rokubacteria bacterium]